MMKTSCTEHIVAVLGRDVVDLANRRLTNHAEHAFNIIGCKAPVPSRLQIPDASGLLATFAQSVNVVDDLPAEKPISAAMRFVVEEDPACDAQAVRLAIA